MPEMNHRNNTLRNHAPRLGAGVAVFAGLVFLLSALTLAAPAKPASPAAPTIPAAPAAPASPLAPAAPTGKIDTEASCTASCHQDYGKKKHVHRAATTGQACKFCHRPASPNKHAFKPQPDTISELCFECHNEQAPSKKVRHMPFESGMCTSCHDPHQSDQAKLLKEPVPQLCQGCHGEDKFKGKVVHGPVAEGKCLGCHHPHQEENPRMLRKEPPELCFGCHDKVQKDAKGITLPATKWMFEAKAKAEAEAKAKADKGKDIKAKDGGKGKDGDKAKDEIPDIQLHPPFEAGLCTTCHQPHASDARRLLAAAYPLDFYASYSEATYGLCFTCHASDIFKEPRTLADTGFRSGNLNLHYRHVNRDKGRYCGACHSPHGSRQPKLINTSMHFGTRTLGIKYEKTETGGTCSPACHSSIAYDRCKSEIYTLKTTPRKGKDATEAELQAACGKEKK